MDKLTVSRVMIIALFLHLSFLQAWGREESGGEQIFGYAESLFEEGDYFRAIGEYKRYIFLHPRAELTQKAGVRIAEALFRAKRWAEAIEACNQFLANYPTSTHFYEILYLRGRAETMANRFDEAMNTFSGIVEKNPPSYSDRAIYQEALIMLELRNWRKAKDFLLQVPPQSPLFPRAQAFQMELGPADQLPHKSPTAAGVLAAVLPGAGHLYTERPRDALVAFLLNATFIWGAVELFQHDNNVAGGIVSFFELGWYTGNVYSAVNSAHKYNRYREEEFIKNIKDRFFLALQRHGESTSLLLSKRF